MASGSTSEVDIAPGLLEHLQSLQSDDKREPRSRRTSNAGPDLPLRFSRTSIASSPHSNDPYEAAPERACHPVATGTLTSPEFRQRVDKDRSFTGSAPPGARPPPARAPSMPAAYGSTSDDNEDVHERRQEQSAPLVRPPPRSPARGGGGGPDLLNRMRSQDEFEEAAEVPRVRRPPSSPDRLDILGQ